MQSYSKQILHQVQIIKIQSNLEISVHFKWNLMCVCSFNVSSIFSFLLRFSPNNMHTTINNLSNLVLILPVNNLFPESTVWSNYVTHIIKLSAHFLLGNDRKNYDFLLFFIRMSLLCLCRNWTWMPFKAFSKCLNHFPQFLKIIPIIIPLQMGFKIYENKHPTSKLNPSKKPSSCSSWSQNGTPYLLPPWYPYYVLPLHDFCEALLPLMDYPSITP